MCFDIRRLLGLGDLFDTRELRKLLTEGLGMSGSIGAHTLTVRKPYCCPASPIIRQALEPYGVKVLNISEDEVRSNTRDVARMMKIEFKHFENLKYGPAAVFWLPLAIEAMVTVPKAQAGWAEYLIERTGRLMVVDGRVDRRNRKWADQHGGNMPTPWDENTAQKLRARDAEIQAKIKQGNPWIEPSCSKGLGIWGALNKAAGAAKQKKGRAPK